MVSKEALGLRKMFPYFREPDLLEEISSEGVIREMKDGETILDYGSNVRWIPLLIEGRIKILRQDDEGHEVFLYHVESGESCAATLSCCMGTASSSIHAVADEDSKFIAIPSRLMDKWMNSFASWREFVIRTYQSRFEELLLAVDSIAFHKLDERLWDYLKEAKVGEKGKIKITHQEIANDLNSSREVISRLLKQLEKLGKVKLGRNTIELIA